MSNTTEFEQKVEALVEQLGEEIAALANDGEEFENGIAIAAIALLDLSLGNDSIEEDDDFLDRLDDVDDLFDIDDDDTDDKDMGWFGSSLDDLDDTDHGP